MRIGILTGGGDVPGLNPCIKAVVNRVAHDGHEVVGLRRGWAALLHHDSADPESAAEWFQPLTPSIVRTIDRTGGTFLHTSRTNPSRVRAGEVPPHLASQATGEGPFDFTKHALRVVEAHAFPRTFLPCPTPAAKVATVPAPARISSSRIIIPPAMGCGS